MFLIYTRFLLVICSHVFFSFGIYLYDCWYNNSKNNLNNDDFYPLSKYCIYIQLHHIFVSSPCPIRHSKINTLSQNLPSSQHRQKFRQRIQFHITSSIVHFVSCQRSCSATPNRSRFNPNSSTTKFLCRLYV